MAANKKPEKADPAVSIRVVSGVEGPSVYINDTRVAGPKPWGGGRVMYEFTACRSDIEDALRRKRG